MMKLTTYEQQIQSANCRAIAFLEKMVAESFVKNKISEISKSYPFINWRIENNNVYNDSLPKITYKEFDECEKTEFVTKCLTTLLPKEPTEIFIVKMKNTTKGAVMAASNHAFCDAPLIAHLVSDLVSTKTKFHTEKKPDLNMLLKDISENHQSFKLNNPFLVPPNKEPQKGDIYYRAIAKTFEAKPLIEACKTINIKPQAFLTACDIYTIAKTFKLHSNFNILSQVSVNMRKSFGLSPIAPMLGISLIYLESAISKELTMKDLMIDLQRQIDNLISNYEKSHFKLLTQGKFDVKQPAAMISNMGIIDTQNADIWAHGGIYDLPEPYRQLQSFSSHACTSRGKFHIVYNMIHPGCTDEFVDFYTKTSMNLFTNPHQALSLKVI